MNVYRRIPLTRRVVLVVKLRSRRRLLGWRISLNTERR